MIHRSAAPRRSAFTLLEVLLAALLTVLLMMALYTALNIQYHHAEAGRELVEESTLAQGLLKRIGDDILQQIAPAFPPSQSGQGGQGGGQGGQGGQGGSSGSGGMNSSGGQGNTGSGGSGGTGNNSTGGGGGTTGGGNTTTTAGNQVTFNLGLQGSSDQLTLYVSRVPGDADGATVVSDLRRISYWLAGGGLAREEV